MNAAVKAKQNDQSTFVLDALEKYEKPLTRYTRRLMNGDLAAAQDVVQHAFLKLCQQDSAAIENHLAPWLYTVCRNRAIDVSRRRGHEQLTPDVRVFESRVADVAHDPANLAESSDFLDHLSRLIDQLPETQREIVELWSQGLSSSEVGDIVGKKAGAVRIALHRVIKELRLQPEIAKWLTEADTVPKPTETHN